MNPFEENKPGVHKSVIAICQDGSKILIHSTPSLFEHDMFDGIFLDDNLTSKKNVPTEPGIYQCDIMYHGYRSVTDCGVDYDVDIWLENVQKLDDKNTLLFFQEKVKLHSQKFDTSLVFSTNALAGEVGEVSNVSKKMKYYEHFPTYTDRVDKEMLEGKVIAHKDLLLEEMGDVLFYCVQTLQRAGLTVEQAIESQVQKLEISSIKYNNNKPFLK